ncbi:hypothetical protein NLX67_04020 [Domibacillus sp. A3M-37]|uniref:hypothetical protein n=1 Tax=Domibacillus sp. A3M-37 TaxID=2962037 RepID=UPI0020B7E956|nr:hypothetical protein [Domibacillus sp. A3M-37]MCP3761552.1 hypothetical protein [Domibacillus sp. A3M-37]
MKTSTMGIIVGSSALASAGAVKVSKGYQRRKLMLERQNREFSAMQEMKKGIKNGVKTGTEKTTDFIRSGIETEEEIIKSGINKTIEGVKTGIETQQKMMEKEKEMLDKMNSTIQEKEMTMGVVVGSTALLTTGIVLALNAYQQKQETGNNQQTASTTMQKVESGIKAGTHKVVEGIKSGIGSKLKVTGEKKQESNDSNEMIVSKTVGNKEFIADESTELKKDNIESVDAKREEAYKGLTALDAQYRDDWQANGFPQTRVELEELEAGEQKEKTNIPVSQMKEKLERNNAE